MNYSAALSTVSVAGSEWPNFKYLMLLIGDEPEAQMKDAVFSDADYNNDDANSDRATASTADPRDPEALSTIDEGDEDNAKYLVQSCRTQSVAKRLDPDRWRDSDSRGL